MAIRPRYRRRNSYRLQGYDYSQPGAYFVTANCINREHLFGKIVKKKMILSEYGQIAENHWLRTPAIRQNIELGEFIIMPDHLHGIIIIMEKMISNKAMENSDPRDSLSLSWGGCNTPQLNDNESHRLISTSQTLGAIMRGYMGAVTSEINKLRETPGAKVWQRNFYDHIIRDLPSFKSISRYIIRNPSQWKESQNNLDFNVQ
jgi:REP element-mobilizing transposase RayT